MRVTRFFISDSATQTIHVEAGSVILSVAIESTMLAVYVLSPIVTYDTISVNIFQSATDYDVDTRAVKYIGSFKLPSTGQVRHCFTDLA